jgi:hypothetical protein
MRENNISHKGGLQFDTILLFSATLRGLTTSFFSWRVLRDAALYVVGYFMLRSARRSLASNPVSGFSGFLERKTLNSQFLNFLSDYLKQDKSFIKIFNKGVLT